MIIPPQKGGTIASLSFYAEVWDIAYIIGGSNWWTTRWVLKLGHPYLNVVFVLISRFFNSLSCTIKRCVGSPTILGPTIRVTYCLYHRCFYCTLFPWFAVLFLCFSKTKCISISSVGHSDYFPVTWYITTLFSICRDVDLIRVIDKKYTIRYTGHSSSLWGSLLFLILGQVGGGRVEREREMKEGAVISGIDLLDWTWLSTIWYRRSLHGFIQRLPNAQLTFHANPLSISPSPHAGPAHTMAISL